ncbi:InlB B-repeat-containing protein, partial [Methanocorpusculum sp. MG]
MNGTKCPDKKAGGLRRGVVLLAALLLACVLMAGAVSATGEPVEVDTYADLIANLSKTGNDAPSTIKLTGNIEATKEISVNRSVTIDGGYHTITAKTGWSQDNGEKDLLVIEKKTGGNDIGGSVTLKNISFESCGNPLADEANLKGAYGIQVYNIPNIQMNLINLVVNGSQGSGINVNGGNVSLQNVTVKNSAWQSVDVSSNAEGSRSAFTMDAASKLEDTVQINTDQPQKEVTITLPDGYTQYSFSYDEKNEYKEQKRVWTTADKIADAANAIATAKKTAFNATVLNATDSSITSYHADLKKALENYVGDGATVTQLKDVTLTQSITITKPITFDGGKKQITGSSTQGFFLKVQVPSEGNNGKSVTLKNLDIKLTSIGTSSNLGGITVQAANNAQSVPVYLEKSTIDMSNIAMTGSMNPAVYFVSAPGSRITDNTISAGSVTSSTSRCVVVDGGSGISVTDNTLNLGKSTEDSYSLGVEIKGNEVTQVTVSGNKMNPPTETSNNNYRAVKITAKEIEGQEKTFTVTGNEINFDGKGTTVEIVLSTYGISEAVNPTVNLKIEGNTGSTESVVMLNKGVATGDNANAIKGSTLTLQGNIYNPALTSETEITSTGGFAEEGSAAPSTEAVTHNNPDPYVPPQPQVSSGDGNMNNAFRVLFETSGGSFISPATGLSYGDKISQPANPVKDGYTFGGWY